MTSLQALFTEGKKKPTIPTKLFTAFPLISSDPAILSGWPHIKGTRVLVTDIFKAQIKGYSYDSLISDFNSMGVKINKSALKEAYLFTIEWLHCLNEKNSFRTA
jgi:uncharacterized protein (DUF433 family)